MLKSPFREGSTTRSVQNPLHLPLPEDDPEAFTIILRILHFLPGKKDGLPSVDQLLSIAKLCDKYDLVAKMQSNVVQWLHLLHEKEDDVSSLQKLCGVTMLMALETEFARVTRKLTLTTTDVTSKGLVELGLPCRIEGWF